MLKTTDWQRITSVSVSYIIQFILLQLNKTTIWRIALSYINFAFAKYGTETCIRFYLYHINSKLLRKKDYPGLKRDLTIFEGVETVSWSKLGPFPIQMNKELFIFKVLKKKTSSPTCCSKLCSRKISSSFSATSLSPAAIFSLHLNPRFSPKQDCVMTWSYEASQAFFFEY